MKKQKMLLLAAFPALLLAACMPAGEQADSPESGDREAEQQQDDSGLPETDDTADGGELTDGEEGADAEDRTDPQSDQVFAPDTFFPAEGTVLHYRGEGNEYAQLAVTVLRSDTDYAILEEDNGGVILHNIYRIGKDRIDLLSSEPAGEDRRIPEDADLDSMEPMQTYFVFAADPGTELGGYVVKDTAVSVDTPYRTFDHAVLAEEESDDFTNRIWFAPGYGEVRRESVMTMEEGEPFIVTSSLESVETP